MVWLSEKGRLLQPPFKAKRGGDLHPRNMHMNSMQCIAASH